MTSPACQSAVGALVRHGQPIVHLQIDRQLHCLPMGHDGIPHRVPVPKHHIRAIERRATVLLRRRFRALVPRHSKFLNCDLRRNRQIAGRLRRYIFRAGAHRNRRCRVQPVRLRARLHHRRNQRILPHHGGRLLRVLSGIRSSLSPYRPCSKPGPAHHHHQLHKACQRYPTPAHRTPRTGHRPTTTSSTVLALNMSSASPACDALVPERAADPGINPAENPLDNQ